MSQHQIKLHLQVLIIKFNVKNRKTDRPQIILLVIIYGKIQSTTIRTIRTGCHILILFIVYENDYGEKWIQLLLI